MICCKISANFNDPKANLEKLFEDLKKCGYFLWENNNLYFGNVDDYSVDEKKIKKILKSNGYSNSFINIYGKDNQPVEEERITYRILDKLIKINYNRFEHENQQMLENVTKGINILDQEIDKLQEKIDAELKEEAEKNEQKKQKKSAS